MPERPPTIPSSEESFAFSHDVHGEEFEMIWTSAMRKRIFQLFEEVGWAEANEEDQRLERLNEAYRLAVNDLAAERGIENEIRANIPAEKTEKSWSDFMREQMDRTLVILQHGNIPSIENCSPRVAGIILKRMTEILGGKA